MPALSIDIEAKYAQVLGALDQIDKRAQTTAASVKGIFLGLGAGLSIAGLVSLTKATVESVAALDDLAEKSSLSVEFLSQLQHVARISGQELSVVADAATKFGKSITGALSGNKALIANFGQLGISVKDLKEQNIDQLFERYAIRIATASDQTNANSLAFKLTGRSAAEALPFYHDLAEQGLGVATNTREAAKEAEQLQKNLRELGVRSQEARDKFLIGIIPGLIRVSEVFKQATIDGDNFLLVLAKTAKAAFFGDDQLNAEREFVALGDKALKLERELSEARGRAEQNKGKASSIFDLDASPFVIAQKEKELAGVNARLKALAVARQAAEKPPKPELPSSGPVGVVPDEKDMQRLARERRALAEATAAQFDAIAKINVSKAKTAAEFQQQLLDREHATALISEQTYWAEKFRIQDDAINAEIAAEERRVAERKRLVDHPPEATTPADQKKNETALLEAQAALDEKRDIKTRQRVILTSDAQAAATRLLLEDGQRRVKNYEDEQAVTEAAKNAVQDYTDAVRIDRQEQELALDIIGKTATSQEKLIGLRKIELDFNRRIAALPNQGEGQTKALADLQVQLEQAKKNFIQFYDAIRLKSRDAFTGAIDALTDYIDHATNAAEQTRNALTNAFKSAEDALVEFAKTGKLNFKALADSIITDLIRIQTRQALAGFANAALPFFQGGGGSFAQAVAEGGSANGNVFSRGNIIPFASGGIVNSPTMFRMANGAGLMGEAGPEAIMPLKRGADGKLGVVAQSSGGGISVTNHLTYNAASADDDRSNADRIGAMIDQRTRASVMSILVQQKRAGGILA